MKVGDKICQKFWGKGIVHIWEIESEHSDHFVLKRMEGFHPHRRVLLKENQSDWSKVIEK